MSINNSSLNDESLDKSLALLNASNKVSIPTMERLGIIVLAFGMVALMANSLGGGALLPNLSFIMSFGLIGLGALIYSCNHYLKRKSNSNNNNKVMTTAITHKGAVAWLIALIFLGFYILMYWYPKSLYSLIRSTDGLSYWLRGKASNQYFLYSTIYTFAMLIMGIKAILKYRQNSYQIVRTLSVMFFQSFFAYLIPAILVFFEKPEKYLNYFWPLSYGDIFPSNVNYLLSGQGKIGIFLLVWTVALSFIAVPILTYFYGKRWYCSWVCGCGGLANTLGDDWRHLSSKKMGTWKIERITIYSVLIFIIGTTLLLWINHLTGDSIFRSASLIARKAYATLIGMVFAGVVGTGFYPIFGTRLWCRFGCPQAAILGIFQRFFSRFRITTNGAQCISCGNCSTYCEMGIDVKWYAQRGQNIVRSSCVGCGMCSLVCPRGVLKLENGASNAASRLPQELSLTGTAKSGSDIFPTK